MKVSITTGRITGLKGEKFYCCRNCYKWLITFAETSQANFCNSVKQNDNPLNTELSFELL